MRPDVIPRLALFAPNWCEYFGGHPAALMDLTVHLVLGCEQGASQIINILLDTSLSTSNVGYHSVNAALNVKNVCRELLELILEEVDLVLRTHGAQSAGVALLGSVRQEITSLMPMLLSANPLRVQTCVRLLCFLKSQSPNIVTVTASYMLLNARTAFHLAALIRYVANNIVLFGANRSGTENVLSGNNADGDHFTQVLEEALRETEYKSATEKSGQLFKNLITLLR